MTSIFYAVFRDGELLPESLRDTWDQAHLYARVQFAHVIDGGLRDPNNFMLPNGLEIARVKIERIGK
jgi:hypothetical protein